MTKKASPTAWVEELKVLIPDPKQRIRLDEFVSARIQVAVAQLDSDKYSSQAGYTDEEFVARIANYEQAMLDVQHVAILLAQWIDPSQIQLLEKLFRRLSHAYKSHAGLTVWLALPWYPVLYVMYSAGIAAVSARRYDTLATILTTLVRADRGRLNGKQVPVLLPAMTDLAEIGDVFKKLPGCDRKRVARNEHMFAVLKPILTKELMVDDADFESLFDRFEVLLSLCFAERHQNSTQGVWAPPGRFAWKMHSHASPFKDILDESNEQGSRWAPLTAGVFRGDAARFQEIAKEYQAFIASLGWH